MDTFYILVSYIDSDIIKNYIKINVNSYDIMVNK